MMAYFLSTASLGFGVVSCQLSVGSYFGVTSLGRPHGIKVEVNCTLKICSET
jgi:hypothetical protein